MTVSFQGVEGRPIGRAPPALLKQKECQSAFAGPPRRASPMRIRRGPQTGRDAPQAQGSRDVQCTKLDHRSSHLTAATRASRGA